MQPHSVLSPESLSLLDQAADFLGKGFDPASCLVSRMPDGAGHLTVRRSLAYALALLMRGDPEGNTRAEKILRSVLSLQMCAPGEIANGAFRHPGDAPAPRGIVSFHAVSPTMQHMARTAFEHLVSAFSDEIREDPCLKDSAEHIEETLGRALRRTFPIAGENYDPDSREHAGMAFAMLLEHFQGQLSPDLVRSVRSACHLLMQSALERIHKNLTPPRSDILIMDIFLLDFFSGKLDVPFWKDESLMLARRLLRDYREYHALCEFNAPGVYAYSLLALAFLARCASSSELRQIGEELREGIWEDLADFYSPSMHALCGPHACLSGEDFGALSALLSLGCGDTDLQGTASPGMHLIPLALLGEFRVSEAVIRRLSHMPSARSVSRPFRACSPYAEPGNRTTVCTASACITPGWMAGAVSGTEAPDFSIIPMTISWKSAEGTGSIRMRMAASGGIPHGMCPLRFDGHADERGVRMHSASGALRNVLLVFEVQCPQISPEQIEPAHWHLPGYELNVETDAPTPEIIRIGPQTLHICYTLTPGTSLNFAFS